ncbi:component of IIS longevity pathway SMK-1-domain-containing protein [Lipomyces japonicus]|uniref:component of IIS longevity pathway SMK-1-domain-containing protein n=1 Tax=Lipomyces japonicus TaxID=56871 RepID=UPI0034CFCE12
MSFDVPVTPRRVKVYELQQENWHDRDESDKLLLETKIFKEVQYQKQQDTLIVWTDPDEIDLALSFQEGEGCASIWEFVTAVQRHLGVDDNNSDDENNFLSGSYSLPSEPSLGNLADVERELIVASHSQYGRDSITRFIQETDYISKLIPLLEMAEDLESLQDLHALCRIMKLIILMNDNTILEQIILDEYIIGVVGILEYDPEFPTFKANHREYISDESRFKEVVPFPDENIKNKIKYTFRLQYLKDVVLARLLDDPTFSMLSSMIYFYQVDIITYLQQQDEFTSALFGIFKPTQSDDDEQQELQKKRNAVQFIHQFCQTAKNLRAAQRSFLYSNFIKQNLFEVIEFALRDEVAQVRISGTELVLAIIDHDPSLVRSAVLKTSKSQDSIVDILVNLLLNERDCGVTSQVSEAIQVLLDPTSGQSLDMLQKSGTDLLLRQRTEDPEVEMFLDRFYDKSVKQLFKSLSDLDKSSTNMARIPPNEAILWSCLCELACAFIKLHGYRSRTFLIESNVLLNMNRLLENKKNKTLRLSVLRCFRQCLSTNDEFYYRFLTKNKLFGPIVKLFVEVGFKNNLLNSACLEFFEFVKVGSAKTEYQRNMKTIVVHIVESYRESLNLLAQIDTVKSLLARYDELTTGSVTPSDANEHAKLSIKLSGQWNDLRDMESHEEDYFNTSDNEDESEEVGKNHSNAETNPTEESNNTDQDIVGMNTPDEKETASLLPLKALGEKRRRAEDERREEEEEEDELGKLSVNNKKKKKPINNNNNSGLDKKSQNGVKKSLSKIAFAFGTKRLK